MNDATTGHAVIAAMTGRDTRIWAMHTEHEQPGFIVVNHGSARRHDRAVQESRANDTGVADVPYFIDVSDALVSATNIVLLGHGTGNSNAARRFAEWARDHAPALHGRIARIHDCDLAALTDAQTRAEGRRVWRAHTA